MEETGKNGIGDWKKTGRNQKKPGKKETEKNWKTQEETRKKVMKIF